jgi:aminomethyltransferase
MQQTPLHAEHVILGAKMVDFAGWHMPLHYGSQLNEHEVVRKQVGVFDVSHMVQIEVKGPQARDYLRYLLANDVAKLKTPGKALYTCLLNANGGVIDDLIVYYLSDEDYLLITNAAPHDKDLAWLNKHAANFNVSVKERTDLVMLAVQGPQAQTLLTQVLPAHFPEKLASLAPFTVMWENNWWVARTGYTGENGYEILLPAELAVTFWRELLLAGVKPVGLGARDTLRLEAAMNLYGTDMDETTTPLEANLGWTVAWEPADRDFIGRKALTAQKAKGVTKQLVCVLLQGKGVLRSHQKVMVHEGIGEITSGSFSPVLQKGIGFALIPKSSSHVCQIEIRGQWQPAQIVKGPFVRLGKIVYETIAEK